MQKVAPPTPGVIPIIPSGVPTNIIHVKMKEGIKPPVAGFIPAKPKKLGVYQFTNPMYMVPVAINSMDKMYNENSFSAYLEAAVTLLLISVTFI